MVVVSAGFVVLLMVNVRRCPLQKIVEILAKQVTIVKRYEEGEYFKKIPCPEEISGQLVSFDYEKSEHAMRDLLDRCMLFI